jgi:hypothetical protein
LKTGLNVIILITSNLIFSDLYTNLTIVFMKRLIPNAFLLLVLNLFFGLLLSGQAKFRYETKMIGGEEIVYSYSPLNDEGKSRNDFPPIWDNPGGSASTMGIILKFECNPRVNDVPLEEGDFIGGFYTDDFGELKCGGASPWPGNQGVVLALGGDDNATPEKDGFDFQEQIYFRVFSWERMKEYDVDVIEFDPDSPTTDKWVSLGLSEVIDLQALVDFDFYISASGNPLCKGNDVTLQANEFVGSNGNYSYNWSSDPPGFDFNIPNPPAVTPDVSTTYFLTVSDGNNVSDHLLTVNVNEEPEVSVAPDASICEDEIFTVSAEAFNYTTVLWTTSGDGYFVNDNSFETDYYPGSGDRANGEVTFTFSAQPISPCNLVASDDLVLTIKHYPSVDAGDDIPGCETNGGIPITAVGIDYVTITWETNGDGTFENPNTISTLYFPGPNDYGDGEVDLTVCVSANAPCVGSDCDEVTMIFYDGPSCNAPPQFAKCEDQFIQCVGVAFNNSGVLWTTEGDGTFDNPSVINAKYYPDSLDRLNGGTTITLNALPIAPCTQPATKDVNVILYPLPRLTTFGEGTDFICPTDNFLQLEADLDHYNTFSWSTNGDGSFTGSNTLSPKYYPGNQDYQNENFELELTGSPISPCVSSVTFSLNTIIYSAPEVQINTQNGSAYCGEVNLSATTDYTTDFSWATSGDGFFNDPALLNPVYFPGPLDLELPASVTLTLEAFSPCAGLGAAQDQVQLFFQDEVSVDAGADGDICETDAFSLTMATAAHFEDIEWTTNGDGSFNNPGAVNPLYFPGNNDILSGQVELTMTGFSIAPCTLVESDQVSLTISQSPVADAGSNATICDTESHQVQNAAADHFTDYVWETTGDGTFNNPGILNPAYTPGAGDLAAGNVELKLNVVGIEPCGFIETDSQTLTIQRSPEANAGNDAVICDNESFTITGSSADDYSNLDWETSGDGSFNNPGNLNPEYFPGPGDLTSGTVLLTLNATGINPCNVMAADAMILEFQQSPEVSSGSDADICSTDTYTLSDAMASNYESVLWETTGNGTFSATDIINPVYTPGFFDLLVGSVTLTITAQGIDPCSLSVSDSHVLSFQPEPEVDAGADDGVCNTGEVLLGDAIVENVSSFGWETSGDGVFSDPTSQNPIYYPGANDINNGVVILTLNAEGVAPCDFSISDDLELTIQQEPNINAGPDATICEGGSHSIDLANGENYGAVLWLSAGDGTYDDQNTLNPVYFPGPGDIQSGMVNLSVIATGISPCFYPAIDYQSLYIQQLPEADAGADATSCNEVVLNGSANNESSILWTTNGDGTFENESALSTTYFPGPDDLMNLNVEIELIAFATAPCITETSDALIFTINTPTIVNDQVTDKELTTGSVLVLTLEVLNADPGEFSWFKDGELIPNQNAAILIVPGVSPNDAGYYQAVFTNPCGEVESNEALVQVLDPVTQTINLEAGWQGISSFVEPDETNIELLFLPIEDQVEILSDNQGVYWPEESINTLGAWSNTTGYNIKMNADATLIIDGTIRYPKQSLTINPGWTYLPVSSSCAINVEEIFGSIPSITLIKDMAGSGVYLPEYGVNNLETIEPGKAYQIYNDSGTPVAINLPDCE